MKGTGGLFKILLSDLKRRSMLRNYWGLACFNKMQQVLKTKFTILIQCFYIILLHCSFV